MGYGPYNKETDFGHGFFGKKAEPRRDSSGGEASALVKFEHNDAAREAQRASALEWARAFVLKRALEAAEAENRDWFDQMRADPPCEMDNQKPRAAVTTIVPLDNPVAGTEHRASFSPVSSVRQ